MTRRIRTGIALVAMPGMLAICERADACSCFAGSACPTDIRGQLVFVATAHVQPIDGEPASSPPRVEESVHASLDDLRLSVDLTVVGRHPEFQPKRERTTLVVERAVRGSVGPQYQVDGGAFGASCDYRFKDGEQYLVYAERSPDGSIQTSICTLTKPLRYAAADLAFLAGEGTAGISATVRGILRFYDGKRLTDSIKVVLERPNGERVFEVETERFDFFDFYPVPPGLYALSVLLNDSERALHSLAILVAPGQCNTDRLELTIGNYEDWLRRGEPRKP